MSNLSNRLIYESLDNAVKSLIKGSYLDNSEYQFSPAINFSELPDNSAYPKIITNSNIGYVDGDTVGVTLSVSILFIPKDLSSCPTKLERDNRIISEAEFHKRTLIEIYWWMVGKLKKSNRDTFRDYTPDGEARFNIYYGMETLTEDQEKLVPDDVVIVSIRIPIRDMYSKLCCPVLSPN